MEQLMVSYTEDTLDSSPSLAFNKICGALIENLCKEVWPCLATIGGIDVGLRVGGACGIAKDVGVVRGVVTGVEVGGTISVQEISDDDETGSKTT